MKKDLFAWRGLVASEFGPKSPTTRLVLLVLSLFMDSKAMSCFPSVKTISKATGLSKKSVCSHLSIAEKGGWIRKDRLGKAGRGWNLNSYQALFPDNAVNVVHHQRGVSASPPYPERGVNGAGRGVNDGQLEKKSGEGQTTENIGDTQRNENNVVNEVQSNQYNYSNNQNEEVNELHHDEKYADTDSKKESDPLSLQKRHRPSKKEWDEFKGKLKKIGGENRSQG